MKNFVKRMLAMFGLRVSRSRQWNRFQAMEETLSLLKARGFAPRVIVDAGANVGQWSTLAKEIFPSARFHLIEPQAACIESLKTLKKTDSRFRIHPIAVTEPNIEKVSMFSVDGRCNTGAYVGNAGNVSITGTLVCATTLDALAADAVAKADRLLLKLDLEGHELAALRGAEKLLHATEVIVVEAHLYEPERLGRCTFWELSSHLQERGFILYDVASLSSRKRDGRLRQGDFVFVRSDSELLSDASWS